MRYLVFVLALWHVGCAEDDIAVEGCGITPGGCCEVDEDCTVLGEAQTCMVDECICNTPTGVCDACLTDEDCLGDDFVCLAGAEGLFRCVDTSSEACIGGSLEDYCNGPCRSFDQALAAANALEEQDVPFCDDGTLWRSYSGFGTCDVFRWVMLRPSLDSRIEFFDAAGTMVAAEYWTDCNCFCDDTSFSKSYGPVPNCERVQTDEPCEVIPFSLGRSPLGCKETNNTTLLFDDSFAEEDWTTEVVLYEANGEPSDFDYSSEQIQSTIDAIIFRLTRHTIDTGSCSAGPCGYSMKGVNRRVGWTYDPQTSGEIDHIHYTESQRVRPDQGSIPRAGLEWTFVVFQDSGSGEQVRYEVARGDQEIASSSWRDKGHCTLSPDDFTPAGLDFGGSPLSFGYARRTTADNQGTQLTLAHSIDNFRIAIVPK